MNLTFCCNVFSKSALKRMGSDLIFQVLKVDWKTFMFESSGYIDYVTFNFLYFHDFEMKVR